MIKVAVGSDDTYSIAKFILKYLEKKEYSIAPVGALKTGKLEP